MACHFNSKKNLFLRKSNLFSFLILSAGVYLAVLTSFPVVVVKVRMEVGTGTSLDMTIYGTGHHRTPIAVYVPSWNKP